MPKYIVHLERDLRVREEWLVDADNEADASEKADMCDGDCISDGLMGADVQQVNVTSVVETDEYE